ncbi:MAG TPA: hypothetical protein VJ761_09145 [Ktedonobacteraceae bacterium]|nr:hypothetical protein [Ktedonobacteraceae bacterium]
MKAAALAFLLLIGAAVVLAFANTLNSWVLGGLIGGLAALLLSIPISLALFTIMARRHDEQLYMQDQSEEEEMVYDDEYAEVYEADAYVLPSDDDQYIAPRRRLPQARHVPASDYPRLPAAGQTHAQAAANGMYNSRVLKSPQGRQRPSQALSWSEQENSPNVPTQRSSLTGALPYRGDQSNSLAKHRTAALRAARIEAARELESESDDLPPATSMSRRIPARPSQPLKLRSNAVGQPRPTRQLSQQELEPDRMRRPADANKGQQTSTRHYRHIENNRAGNPELETGALRAHETETENLRGRLDQTEPLRRNPETGKFARNPQLREYSGNQETITGSLKNPLVRRPPYMYEDDPMREEMSQFVERPITRRSSLRESLGEQED